MTWIGENGYQELPAGACRSAKETVMTLAEKPGTAVDDAAQLRALVGEESLVVQKKVLDRLDTFCRDFIALSPFLVLATADREGGVDASPRGDGPGFVEVLDERTLLIPDRRGNNRIDSFRNVLSSPGVGLVFFVPGIPETLRVNGRARMTTDAALLEPLAMQEKAPKLGLIVEVDEAYFHCGKALLRSKLWAQEAQVERSSFPTLGRIVAEQTKAVDAAEADANLEEAYRLRLY
jgi:PPOX class probable FMN-dependent enzyme